MKNPTEYDAFHRIALLYTKLDVFAFILKHFFLAIQNKIVPLPLMYYYREYSPDQQLAKWVNNYWYAVGFNKGEVRAKIYPDNSMDIIFAFDYVQGLFTADFYGIMTNSFEFVEPDRSVRMFGVRFKPSGIKAFMRIPTLELANRNEDLRLFNTPFDQAFCDALPEKQTADEIVAHTNRCLISRLPNLFPYDSRIIHAINMIEHTKGQLNLTNLASEVCLGQRHFERQFKDVVGIAPKTFAKISRFEHARQQIVEYPNEDLLSVAIKCGYYDQTHLINDFKLFTGDTPNNFRKKT
jgi:AraC-like DNA-binding protein